MIDGMNEPPAPREKSADERDPEQPDVFTVKVDMPEPDPADLPGRPPS